MKTVQLLLQMNSPQAPPSLVADGVCGPGTIAAIDLYQRGVIGGADKSGFVSVERGNDASQGTTLRALRQGMANGFSAQRLQAIYIHAPAAVIVRFFVPIVASMSGASIDTPLRRAHFLAQVGHESGELRYTQELASGAAYEGRADLGNTEAGDGERFKGRGLIQLTGRTNYAAFGLFVQADLLAGESCCRVATDPALAVQAATWFWQRHGLNRFADEDDLIRITRVINGGTNGLADRQALLTRAKWFLEPLVPTSPTLARVQAAARRYRERDECTEDGFDLSDYDRDGYELDDYDLSAADAVL